MYEYQFDGKTYEKYRDSLMLFEIKKHSVKSYYAHFHYAVEVCYVIKGELEYAINGRKQIAKQDEIVFINPGEMHQYFQDDSCELYVVIMSELYSQDYTLQFGSVHFSNLLQNKEVNKKIKLLLDECYKKRKDNYFFENKIFANSLYSYIFRNYPLKEQSNNDLLLNKILEYIYTHYQEQITIKEISQALGYSAPSISKIFQQDIGVDFRAFINDIRAERVHIMLNDSKYNEWSLSRIVTDCGFVSLATFYRSYQRRFNTTPERKN